MATNFVFLLFGDEKKTCVSLQANKGSPLYLKFLITGHIHAKALGLSSCTDAHTILKLSFAPACILILCIV